MINGWIMSGDTAVASFHGRVVTPILPERCPLCFQKGGDLEMWLESRAIDRHRTNSRILMDGLDKLDQKIIRLLIENARISYSDIGEETGISRVAVKARIQALEKRGVIEEYTTIINPQKISGAVSCYFEIETKPEYLAQVTDILYKNNTVTQIYRVTGRDRLHGKVERNVSFALALWGMETLCI